MLSCEASQLLIADGLYGDLPSEQQQALQQHIEHCQHCRDLLDDLQAGKNYLEGQGLASGNFDDIPERVQLDSLWENIEPALDSIDADRYRSQARRFRPAPWLAGGIAMAACLLLFISILPIGPQTETGGGDTVSELASNPAIAPELLNYLNRVETLLMTVANTEANNTAMVPVQQTFARDMALQANFMSNDMNDSFSSGQSRLLRDIEFMLLQIANLDESNMEEGVQLLQQYMEDNSVLLKIRLMEMRNQAQVI
ncbi:MAG: zf-HC2 domain-containing protein [Pseudomonadales bacterium]|nr:zf-HC2 domain-containing protein [Pseudomonadales bacterium]